MTLVYRLTDWYLYGYCKKREDYRVFKLSRIIGFIQTENTFVVREKQWESEYFTKDMDYGDRDIEFVVKVEKAKVIIAIDLFTYDNIELQSDGTAIVKAKWPESQIIDALLKLGSGIRIMSPDWLKGLYVDEASKMIDNNSLDS